ncbi:hypothetical protein FQN50_007047 [Emmonsiellopsis sp. PD_5]|nr:hypothetical protein FQN50_007047 [Emmonsiellopsis sp. PD_5]
MSHLNYCDYEGFGQTARKNTHYSQAVRIGDRIECSGQGGWDRLTEEIAPSPSDQVNQAFANVEHALKRAGGKGWSQVYKVRAYAAPLTEEIVRDLVRNLRQYCPDHMPLLTGVGVQSLAFGMCVEIEVVAHVGEEK